MILMTALNNAQHNGTDTVVIGSVVIGAIDVVVEPDLVVEVEIAPCEADDE